MTDTSETLRIAVPPSVQTDVRDALKSDKFLDWWYPVTIDETLESYINKRKGNFDATGFTIFVESNPDTVHYEHPVQTPPQTLLDAIEAKRKPSFSESFTLRIQFSDTSWTTIEDMWASYYRIDTEPADLEQ